MKKHENGSGKQMRKPRMTLWEILDYLKLLLDDDHLMNQEGTLIIHCTGGDMEVRLSGRHFTVCPSNEDGFRDDHDLGESIED